MKLKKQQIHKINNRFKRQKEICSNKKRYNNPTSAIAIALIMNERDTRDIFYYKCDLCKGFHLTQRGGGTSILCF